MRSGLRRCRPSGVLLGFRGIVLRGPAVHRASGRRARLARRLRETLGGRSVRALPCSYFPLRVLGWGRRRPFGMFWSRQGILPEAGEPSGWPGILASPAEVDFVVPILNQGWAGSYSRGVLLTLSCRSSCGRLSFSLLRPLCRCQTPVECRKSLLCGHAEALSESRGDFCLEAGTEPTAALVQHYAIAVQQPRTWGVLMNS